MFSIDEFQQNQKEYLQRTIDIVDFRCSYKKIASILSSEIEMEQMNLLLRQKFLYVNSISAFIQSASNKLIHALSHQDIESGKYIFQLEY